ncbi:MAG: DUF1343 domain-containing protein [Desulfobacterales bacterium]
MQRVITGLENLSRNPPAWLGGRRLGLLSNPASVDPQLRHARDIIARRFPDRLTALYAPQHGFQAEKQDNMIESADGVDPVLNIPIFSLYGTTRIPTRDMFDPIDVLLVDLQDAGTRVYTFIYTLSYCMEAARTYSKKVVVLDRPNPVNGQIVEGNCVAADCTSFVGRYPIPMRHGLTIGEMALLFNRHFGIGCELEVIPMKNWRRAMHYAQTGLPWVPPSPNLPTPTSAMVYPGQVLWEGTNVSEGRGTTQPFELFGAPFIEPHKISVAATTAKLPGIILRPVTFEPTAHKWRGRPCHGFQLHVTDPQRYRPYAASLELLQAVIRHHRREFAWKPPPYEYEYEQLPIDLIIGDRAVRERIESLEPIADIALSWREALAAFVTLSRSLHLYD